MSPPPLDVDDELDTPDLVADLDLDIDPKADELLAVVDEEAESWSDGPVRMYLTQMGEIPLLTRQEEIALAKRIEITRANFRARLLECDYVIQDAVKVSPPTKNRVLVTQGNLVGGSDETVAW